MVIEPSPRLLLHPLSPRSAQSTRPFLETEEQDPIPKSKRAKTEEHPVDYKTKTKFTSFIVIHANGSCTTIEQSTDELGGEFSIAGFPNLIDFGDLDRLNTGDVPLLDSWTDERKDETDESWSAFKISNATLKTGHKSATQLNAIHETRAIYGPIIIELHR